MRRVSGPDGVAWSIDVRWTDVRLGTQFKRMRARRARERRERADARAAGTPVEGRGGWFGWADAVPDDSWSIITVVVVVIVVALAVLAFPWLAVLFLDLAVILAFPVLAFAIIGWRIARRRPFAITADRDHETVAQWRVVGVRDARRIERAIADAIVAGGDPVDLFPEYADRY